MSPRRRGGQRGWQMSPLQNLICLTASHQTSRLHCRDPRIGTFDHGDNLTKGQTRSKGGASVWAAAVWRVFDGLCRAQSNNSTRWELGPFMVLVAKSRGPKHKRKGFGMDCRWRDRLQVSNANPLGVGVVLWLIFPGDGSRKYEEDTMIVTILGYLGLSVCLSTGLGDNEH
jgi:hypothetical protein